MTLCPKREYFNGLADRWDGFPKPPDAAEKLARFVRQAVPATAGRILDVGCGTGVLLDPLRSCRGTLAGIVELDSAEQMLRQNRQKSDDGESVSQVCADAGSLPFSAGSFDAILCFNALPHLEPVSAVLQGMLECLRPGGVLSVCHLMGSESLNSFHAAVGGAVAHDHLPDAAHLTRLLSDISAEVVCAEEAPDWYFVQARKRA